ncbi:hypothetical protein HID58_043120 [Brassica napus]|uniref:Uncharacterized protein n=1 Tax=Brassica napus TaxID=3708 RepID=A0ABQ8BFK4_BRANA|nr:hypothetical protein HID58_043120 [Brassica napus]
MRKLFQILTVWFPMTQNNYFYGATVSYFGRETCRSSAGHILQKKTTFQISVTRLSWRNIGQYSEALSSMPKFSRKELESITRLDSGALSSAKLFLPAFVPLTLSLCNIQDGGSGCENGGENDGDNGGEITGGENDENDGLERIDGNRL